MVQVSFEADIFEVYMTDSFSSQKTGECRILDNHRLLSFSKKARESAAIFLDIPEVARTLKDLPFEFQKTNL
jgi:hypothetical protein